VFRWSLEELELYLDIGEETITGAQDTIANRLVLECAQWTREGGLELSSSLRCLLPPSRMRWKLRSSDESSSVSCMTLPVYLNDTRRSLVVEVKVPLPSGVPPQAWAQRGVCVIMQNSV
jgi:hypothetical protein